MKYFRQNGFSLVELLIAVTIAGIVSSALIGFFIAQQRSHSAQEQVTFMQQNIRAGLGLMSKDLRMAGYNPTKASPFASFFSGPEVPTVASSTKMLGPGVITFAYDLDADGLTTGSVLTTGAAEKVKYALDGSELKLYDMNATPISAVVVAEDIESVAFAFAFDSDGDGQLERVGNVATGDILFATAGVNGLGLLDDPSNLIYWYDLNGVVVKDAANVEIIARAADIRAVRIWLLAKTGASDPNYKTDQTYWVGANELGPYTDNMRRRLLDTVVLCRNMGL